MLIGNAVRDSRNPLQKRGTVPGGESENFVGAGALRNFHGEARVSGESLKASRPSGASHPYTWSLPTKPGALASRGEIAPSSALAAAGAMGVNGESQIDATSSFDAIGELVVSAIAAITGQGAVSANVLAALQMAASLASSGDASGAISALAWAVGGSTGGAAASGTATATGTMASDIEVGAQVGLSAPLIAEEILDTQMVETGLTVRETLRICLAALAGKISGAPGSTLTIRSADDSADRIVAVVDADGNRTDITLNAG